jgi:phosphate starvation-inducible PhoH-like protein
MKPSPFHWTAPADDNTRLANLCGPLDANLRQIEQALNVKIARRGSKLKVDGEKPSIQKALDVINHFFELSRQPIPIDELQLILVEYQAHDSSPDSLPKHMESDVGSPLVLKTKRGDLQSRTPRQKAYLEHIVLNDLTFGIGPAGTGKTFLAVACAIDALERDAVKRIILTRPAVEAGERLGFLPGDLTQKVDPYLRPLYDALYELAGFEKVQKLFERNAIEIAPLAYMRGRTLNHAFVILDEAQNTTPEQMKMFLTRIGFGSKAVVTGDVTQIDLPKGHSSGLIQAQKILQQISGIGFTYFTSKDVVRHPLVAKIVDAYEQFDQASKQSEKNTK